MSNDMVVRQFKDADEEQVCRIYLDYAFDSYHDIPALKSSGESYLHKVIENDLRSIRKNYIDMEGANFWVADVSNGSSDSCIVGTCAITREKGENCSNSEIFEVVRMVVHPDQRGSGVAVQLINTAETYVRDELKGKKLFLETLLENIPACKFYEKCGFLKVGEPKAHTLGDDGTVIHPQRFEKCLP